MKAAAKCLDAHLSLLAHGRHRLQQRADVAGTWRRRLRLAGLSWSASRVVRGGR
jgi:hypothetical protein